MSSTSPPPIPSVHPAADLDQPVPVGTRLGSFIVAESSASRLVLKTPTLAMLVAILATGLSTLFLGACLLTPSHDPVTVYSNGGISNHLWLYFLVSLLLFCICIGLLGQSAEFDARHPAVHRTRLFVFHSHVPTTELRSVRILIRNRVKPPEKTSTPPALVPGGTDEAVLSLIQQNAEELIELARADLDTPTWPHLVSTARQAARLLSLPLTTEGHPQYATPASQAIFTALTSAERNAQIAN